MPAQPNNAELIIRQAGCFDWPRIAQLVAAGLPWVRAGDLSYVLRNRRESVWVATFDGAVQAVLVLYLHRENGRAFLDYLVVDDHARGQGIGAQLMQWAIGQASEAQCELLSLAVQDFNEPAIAFYRSLGFREVDRTAGNIGFQIATPPAADARVARPPASTAGPIAKLYWRLVYLLLVELPARWR